MDAASRLIQDNSQDEPGLAGPDYWAKQGAGCIVLSRSSSRILFAYRSSEVSDPHCWSTIGGSIDGGEGPAATVRRELAEEAGYQGPTSLYPLLTFRSADIQIQYQNYLAVVDHEFTPIRNWETDAFRWVPYGQWPTPMHPGLEALLSDATSLSTIRYHLKRGK